MTVKDSYWYNKSHYLTGFGFGLIFTSLYLLPMNGSLPIKNVMALITGAIMMIVGGVFGTISRRKKLTVKKG